MKKYLLWWSTDWVGTKWQHTVRVYLTEKFFTEEFVNLEAGQQFSDELPQTDDEIILCF